VTQVAGNRTTLVGDAPVRQEGAYILYWMIATRRAAWNHALDRAIGWAVTLRRPLLVFEPLRVDYPWASARLHRFIIDGMLDNARAFGRAGITYVPYVEPATGAGKGLLAALAANAAVVVTDDYPAFMLPRMVEAARRQVPVRFERVDSNGLVPMRLAETPSPTAHAFRRHLQRALPTHLPSPPASEPLDEVAGLGRIAISQDVTARWPSADLDALVRDGGLDHLPIDHAVGPTGLVGGATAGHRAMERFLDERLSRYADTRNDVTEDVTSGLSPYLHFGHLSSHAIVSRVLARDGWLGDLSRRATGAREGWWGASPAAEAFLDQVVTWRELGFNTCVLQPGYDRYESLPAWARATLERHARDEREHRYDLDGFERAATHDPLWNAAQGQLVREGRIHNYLRMLWGKKILEWSATPAEALAVMIELNNKYALDGRDPNSYSGIFWTLGRYDRPWAPERPVFGTVRYMSSANTARKMRVGGYIARYAPEAGTPALFD
jgi:deoxyribodipyrimidine photo-lyase